MRKAFLRASASLRETFFSDENRIIADEYRLTTKVRFAIRSSGSGMIDAKPLKNTAFRPILVCTEASAGRSAPACACPHADRSDSRFNPPEADKSSKYSINDQFRTCCNSKMRGSR